MKILKIERLLSRGQFSASKEMAMIENNLCEAIATITHPHDSELFILNNTEKHCNGVTPIKTNCMEYLWKMGWQLEQSPIPELGPLDAIQKLRRGRYFAVEWETGNVSSSHRALNKMKIGMQKGHLAGGILVIPSRKMYMFLTDRVGNYQEIEPYFTLWSNDEFIRDGVLAIVEIEHDAVSPDVPRIKKGTDGRALK